MLYSHLDVVDLLITYQVIFIFEMILFWKLLVEMSTQLLSVVSSRALLLICFVSEVIHLSVIAESIANCLAQNC